MNIMNTKGNECNHESDIYVQYGGKTQINFQKVFNYTSIFMTIQKKSRPEIIRIDEILIQLMLMRASLQQMQSYALRDRNYFQASNVLQIGEDLISQQQNNCQIMINSESVQDSRVSNLKQISKQINQIVENNGHKSKNKIQQFKIKRGEYLQKIGLIAKQTYSKLSKKQQEIQININSELLEKIKQASDQNDEKLKKKFEDVLETFSHKIKLSDDAIEIRKQIKCMKKKFQNQTLMILQMAIVQIQNFMQQVNSGSKKLNSELESIKLNYQQLNFQQIKSKVKAFQDISKQLINNFYSNIQNIMQNQFSRFLMNSELKNQQIKQCIEVQLQSLKVKLKQEIKKSIKNIYFEEKFSHHQQNIINTSKSQLSSRYFVAPFVTISLLVISFKTYVSYASSNTNKNIENVCNIQWWFSHVWKVYLIQITLILLSIFLLRLIISSWKQKRNRILLLFVLIFGFSVCFYMTSKYNISLNSNISSQNYKCYNLLTRYNSISISQNSRLKNTTVYTQINQFLNENLNDQKNLSQENKAIIITGFPGVGKTTAVKEYINKNKTQSNQTNMNTHTLYFSFEHIKKDSKQSQLNRKNKPDLMVELPLMQQFVKIEFETEQKIEQMMNIIRYVTVQKNQKIIIILDEVNSMINNPKFIKFFQQIRQQMKNNKLLKVIIISTQQNSLNLSQSESTILRLKSNKKKQLKEFFNLKIKLDQNIRKKDLNFITNSITSFRQANQMINICELQKLETVNITKLQRCLKTYKEIKLNTLKEALIQSKIKKQDFCKNKYMSLSQVKLRQLINRKILYNRYKSYNKSIKQAMQLFCNERKKNKTN